jgi:two-component system, sensor histidine kinase YesM
MVYNFLKNRFAPKVVIAIVIVILIPTIFNSSFFYLSATNVVKENVRESSLQIARQAADSLSYIFSVGSDMSDLVYSNERLQEIVEQDNNNELSFIERTQNNDEMLSFLNSNIYSSSFVRIIYVMKEEGTSWGSGTFSPYKLSKVQLNELDWVKEAVQNDGEVVWQGLQYDQFSGAGENTELVLPISRVMKDFNTLENIAYIQVSLDGKAILEKINQLKLGKTGRFFVVNQQGRVMIDSNLNNINKIVRNTELYNQIIKKDTVEFEFFDEEKRYYGVKQPISNGWSIIGVVPVEEITGELTDIQMFTILTSVLFAIVAMVIGLLTAKRVTKPIQVLTNQMKLVGKGNFTVRTQVQSTDEIGMMSAQFNKMINQIEQLMEQVKEEQNYKQEAELRAIKHRINPHFLFNTLSTIRWLVKFNQTDRANKALAALSRLLEANMGKKGTFITVKEELDIIEKFMAILQIRYEQSFHLNVELNEEVEGFFIPRMLLQPIVENAIFHGVVPTGKEGTIHIRGRQITNGVEIEICNNGKGIEKETLSQLQQTYDPKNTFVGIGLRHVFDSVRLYFHPDSKVNIESSDKGTIVKLVLRSKTGGENHV